MGSFGKFLGGLLVGAAVGAAVTIFAAPKTGDETRADIATLWGNALDTGKVAAQQREAELWAEFNSRVTDPNALTTSQVAEPTALTNTAS